MLSKKFLATCTVTAGLLTAASSNAVANWGSNANAAAAAQYLERGGSFYAVTDAQSIKPQIQYILKSIFSRFPAATAQKLESYQNIFDMGCTIAGINDVQAIGQSSKVMIPARNGKPAIYHNRLVITTANKGKLPLFMQVANGTPAKLQQVASIIPDNAKYAVYGSLNPMPLYNAIDGMGLIPADFKNEFKTNMGCQISDLLNALSGNYVACLFDVYEDKCPSALVIMPDKNHLIYGMICKAEGKNPATTQFIETKDPAFYLKVTKTTNGMMLFFGENTEAMFQKKLQSRQTIANSPMYRTMAAKIPASAAWYEFDCMDFGKKGLCGISATVFDKDGMKCYANGYYDWNVLPLALIAKIADEVMSMTKLYAQELPLPAVQ